MHKIRTAHTTPAVSALPYLTSGLGYGYDFASLFELKANFGLPILQSIHEKYKDRGVVVVGIDPYDDPAKDEMATFLSKRGITYTALFSDHELSKDYHVHAFPTLFLLDRQGRIIMTHLGFSKEMGAELEELLLKML